MSYVSPALHWIQGGATFLLSAILLLSIVFAPLLLWFVLEKSGKLVATALSLALFVSLWFLFLPAYAALADGACEMHRAFCDEDE